jgi:hypothetical protein
MPEENRFSPPVAQVADIAVASPPVEPRAPRTFLVLLAIYFLLEIAGIVLAGNYVWLARIVVLGIATWRTLQGSRAASRFLGLLFAVGALLSFVAAYSRRSGDAIDVVDALVPAVLLSILTAYIFLSPKMKALYASADTTRWRQS